MRQIIDWLLRKLAISTGIQRCMYCGRWFRRKNEVVCSDRCYNEVMLDQYNYAEWYE